MNPAKPRRSARLKFLVDSGALYSVVPGKVLRRLGIKPGKTKTFILADGSEVKRSIGQVLFRLNGGEGASPVILGEDGDSVLLGSVSLESLGFILDPLKRELRPLPMLLAFQKPLPSVEERLKLFRNAQERQRRREMNPQKPEALPERPPKPHEIERGWRREDLYTRGRSR